MVQISQASLTPVAALTCISSSPMLTASQKEYSRTLSHCDGGCIAAVHPDQAAAALATAGAGAFPTLGGRTPSAPAPLPGAWAARQLQQHIATVSTDAVDVHPKAAAPAQPYVPPALRAGACADTLAGCPMPRPAVPTPAPLCQPYIPPYRRTAEQQAGAAAAPRPGRPCPFPALTAGPLPAPLPVPLPLYRLALLSTSQPLAVCGTCAAEPAFSYPRCAKRACLLLLLWPLISFDLPPLAHLACTDTPVRPLFVRPLVVFPHIPHYFIPDMPPNIIYILSQMLCSVGQVHCWRAQVMALACHGTNACLP